MTENVEEQDKLAQRLRNENDSLQKQNERYASELATMETHVKFYKGEVERLTADEEMFHNKAKAYKTEKFEIQDKMDELEHENQRLTKLHETAEEDKKNLEAELKLLKERYSEISLNHEASDRLLKVLTSEKSEWEKRQAELTEKYEVAEKERAMQKAQLERTTAELATWNKEEAEEQLTVLKKEKFDMEMKLEELVHENTKLKKLNERTSDELDAAKVSDRADTEEKLQELVHVQKQKEILTAKVAEYEDEIATLNQTVGTLRKAKLELTNGFDDLQFEHDRMKKVKATLEEDLANAETQTKEKDALIAEMKTKAKNSADELFDLQMSSDKMKRERAAMEEKIEAQEEETKALKQEKKEKEEKMFDSELQLGKLQREVERWKEETDTQRQNNLEISKQMEVFELKLKEVGAEQKQWENRYDEASNKLAAAEKAHSKTQIEVQQLEEEIKSWNKVAVAAEMASLKKAKLDLELQFEDLKLENSKLRKRNEEADGELVAAKIEAETDTVKSEELIAMTKQKMILQAKVDEHAEAMGVLNAQIDELKKQKLDLTHELDGLQFEHERLKKMKIAVDADFGALETQMEANVAEIAELKMKAKTIEDEKFDAELQLDKEKRRIGVLEEKLKGLEETEEEVKKLKAETKEKEEKLFDAELNMGKLNRELERLREEADQLRKRNTSVMNQMEEYIMKAKEAEVEKGAEDSILQIQLQKAHTKIAELKEQLEDASAKDSKIEKLQAELVDSKNSESLEAKEKIALKQELDELKRLAEEFKSTDRGELMTEVMMLKRKIDAGKKKIEELLEENMLLQTQDKILNTQRSPSFLATNQEEKMFSTQRSADVDETTQAHLLDAMKQQYRKLSTQHVKPAMLPSGMNRTETVGSDELDLGDMPDSMDDKSPLKMSDAASSTMDPGWDFHSPLFADTDAPLPTGPD